MEELFTCIAIALTIMFSCFTLVEIYLWLVDRKYWEFIKYFLIFFIVLTGFIYLLRYGWRNAQMQANGSEATEIYDLLGDE